MSEFEQRKELRKLFLRIVYQLSEGRPGKLVAREQVAAEMQNHMDTSIGSAFVDELDGITEYLGEQGWIKKQTTRYGVLSITSDGVDEVERAETSEFSTPMTPDEFSNAAAIGEAPVEIRESLRRFEEDHPDPAGVAFIMMQFGQTRAHNEITEAIRVGLDMRGIKGVRADDKRYHDHLFYNVLTYMHGCGLGIAVFERIEVQTYNPNVALEVGYLFAMRKPVCLLKDRTLETLQADLVGRLYDEFDPQDAAATVPPAVQKWLADKGL